MWRFGNNGSAVDPEDQRVLAWLDTQRAFFDPTQPLLLSRAPGRLDVMGGIGDYSGSLVLEMPIAGATWVAAQSSREPVVAISSEGIAALGSDALVTIPLDELVPAHPLSYEGARALLTKDRRRSWAAYVAGALVVLHAERGRPLRQGLRLAVRSEVPVGKGLSSSAALEVATLEAVAPLVGANLEDREVAFLAQKIENFVVGAPCGVMDQMTSALGRRDELLALLCQPGEVVGRLPLPKDLEFIGIDSGIRHAVSGADYGTVRTAAFMGYRMIAAVAGLTAQTVSPGRVVLEDPLFGGYLANVPAEDWQRHRQDIPSEMSGAAFLAGFQGTTDTATRVDPARSYPVRAATAHAIEEHARVREFRRLVNTPGRIEEATRARLGELMYAAHGSYSACGLGSDGTDRLVELVREAGPEAGLYGAKITGGGSGGTVAVLAGRGRQHALTRLVERYSRESGRRSVLYVGSSDGARAFGLRTFLPEQDLET